MSKSRTDRGKTPAQSQPAPVPVSNDIVPGRFTENDWNHLVDEETEEDFVTDILQDVIKNALDTIYNKVLEQRVIPYTVDAARKLLLDVIEWQFLVNDPGESDVNTDETWLDDEEPAPGVTDSWAQGIVPVVNFKEEEEEGVAEEEGASDKYGVENNNHPFKNDDEVTGSETDQITERLSRTVLQSNKDDVDCSVKHKGEGSKITEKTVKEVKEKIPPKPPGSKKMKGKSFKPHRGKLPCFHSITMTPVTDERPKPGSYHSREAVNESTTGFLISSESLLKAHYGLPPGTKEVAYDYKGQAIQMQKLNFDCLPSHRVKTKFTVIDPLEEAFQAKQANKKKRYNFLRHETRETQKGNRNSINNNTTTINEKKTIREKELKLVSPLPPPLVDTIDVSPGVVIKEKGVIKRGLRQQPLTQSSTNDAPQFHPLDSGFAKPSSKLKEVIPDPNPIIKCLNTSRPLPAIGAHNKSN